MRFTLEIELGNDAMRRPWDVGRSLILVAAKVEQLPTRAIVEGECGVVKDLNGNTVGRWDFSDDT